MKALVTGASGFIGSTLIGELDTLGFDVRALMRKTSTIRNLEGVKFQPIEGNLGDFESLCRAVRDVDYVFHLAGVTQARTRSEFIEWNARGTERLARAVATVRPGLTRFVYVSSLSAAGPAQSLQPKTESEIDLPVSEYGLSKLQGERELLKYRDLYSIAIARPPIVYGPKDKAVFMMIQAAARNLMPILQGSNQTGQKYYSTIHAKDLCRGLVQVALAPKEKVPSGDMFYLSGDEIFTYQELVSLIAEKLNCEPLRVRVPKIAIQTVALSLSTVGLLSGRTYPLNLDKLKELIPDYWICSNQKAKQVLSFMPEFDLTTGLSQVIEWYKNQRWI